MASLGCDWHWRQVETIAADLRADRRRPDVLTNETSGRARPRTAADTGNAPRPADQPPEWTVHDRSDRPRERQVGRTANTVLSSSRRFRRVNESLGHAAGDRLSRVRAASPGLGSGGRHLRPLGGDEFGVLLDGDPSRKIGALWRPDPGRLPPAMSAGQGRSFTVSLGMR